MIFYFKSAFLKLNNSIIATHPKETKIIFVYRIKYIMKQPKKTFVYGKEINDFHTVDYDRVFTLSVYATQELYRKVEALEKQNTKLKKNVLDGKQANVELKAELNGMEERLEKVEMIMNALGGK